MMTLLNNILCNQYTPPCVGWVIPQLSWKKIPIGEISSLKYLVDYGVRSRLQLPSLLTNEARLKALRSLKPKPPSLIVYNMAFSVVSFYQTFKTIFFIIINCHFYPYFFYPFPFSTLATFLGCRGHSSFLSFSTTISTANFNKLHQIPNTIVKSSPQSKNRENSHWVYVSNLISPTSQR